MNKWNRKPDIATLRAMAQQAKDPVVAKALRDLADEYERLEQDPNQDIA